MSNVLKGPDLIATGLAVARSACDVARGHGAQAGVLTGSFARGDAHPRSDIDLHFIGDGPAYELSRENELLVSASWSSAADHRASFRDPRRAGAAVPAWRAALILFDPDGIAATLQREAVAWSWDDIGAGALDGWVVEQIAGFAEEVHKLVAAIERGRVTMAAVQRSVLALRLAAVMSVNCRLLYDTENQLWDLVSAALGGSWASAQARALGLRGESFEETCLAALELYCLADAACPSSGTRSQRDVISHARTLAERAINRSSRRP